MGKRKGLKRLREAAFLGSISKIEKVLRNYGEYVDLTSVCDDEGSTPLHIASRWGHEKLVDYLVEADVPLNVVKNDGDTALHLALLFNHANVAKLLVSAGALAGIPNKNNTTAQELLDAIDHQRRRFDELLEGLDGHSDGTDLDDYVAREDEAVAGKRGRDENDDDSDFRQRLWDEMDGDDSMLHDFEEQGYHDGHTSEDWREAIAEAMRRKRRQQYEESRRQARAGRASPEHRPIKGPSWNEEAKRRSDRIIREQLEKELGSRAARRADRVAQLRKEYEKKWSDFETARACAAAVTPLTYDEMPWPCASPEDIKEVMLSGIRVGDSEGRKARVRAETRRWHPDKWRADMVTRPDFERTMERVKLIVQMLNDLKDRQDIASQ